MKKFIIVICLISLSIFTSNFNFVPGGPKTALAALSQPTEFTGQVLNPDGTAFNPSENSYVTVVVKIRSSNFIEYSTDVKNDGTFYLPVYDCYRKDYTIIAYARGTENPYASSCTIKGNVERNLVSHKIRLMMPVVEGKVLDPDGNPLNDYTGVTVTTPHNSLTTSMVNEDGSYKIGVYSLYWESFELNAHIDYEKNPGLEFADGQETVELGPLWGSVIYKDIRLTKPIVQGRLYYHDGTPFNPVNHTSNKIFAKPVTGESNGRLYNTKVNNNGYYRLGGDIAPGSEFVIHGYSDTMPNFTSHKYESLIPKTITLSEGTTQNVDLVFGSSFPVLYPTTEDSMDEFFCQEGTYISTEKKGLFLSSLVGVILTGQGKVDFMVDKEISISNSTSIEFNNINFTSAPGAFNAIVECSTSRNIIFRNCEFSGALSVTTHSNSSSDSGSGIRFENCRINNIYGDVFHLSENDTVYLKDCIISQCANLTNRPDAIFDGGNNQITDIGPDKCGALISGKILNPDGTPFKYDFAYIRYFKVCLENIKTKNVYEVPVYNGRYALKGGIPDGSYRVLYKWDTNYIQGIDTGEIVSLNKALSTVHDITISPKNVGLRISFLGSDGSSFNYMAFSSDYNYMKASIYNEIGELISTTNALNQKYQLNPGNYKIQAKWYFEDRLIGISEPLEISVGEEEIHIEKNVVLNPAIEKAAFIGDGWIQNTENGHYYKIIKRFNSKLSDFESYAVNSGGHIVTINTREENDWLTSIYGSYLMSYWIGYYYDEGLGKWKWISNEESEYTNWYNNYGFNEPKPGFNYTVFNMKADFMSWEGKVPGKWISCDTYNYPCYLGIIEANELPAQSTTPTPTQIPTPTPAATLTPTPTPLMLIGDVNTDGSTDSTDYTLLKRYVLKIINDFPAEDDYFAADVNGDGSIDSTDITFMKRYLLHIITKFPKDV